MGEKNHGQESPGTRYEKTYFHSCHTQPCPKRRGGVPCKEVLRGQSLRYAPHAPLPARPSHCTVLASRRQPSPAGEGSTPKNGTKRGGEAEGSEVRARCRWWEGRRRRPPLGPRRLTGRCHRRRREEHGGDQPRDRRHHRGEWAHDVPERGGREEEARDQEVQTGRDERSGQAPRLVVPVRQQAEHAAGHRLHAPQGDHAALARGQGE